MNSDVGNSRLDRRPLAGRRQKVAVFAVTVAVIALLTLGLPVLARYMNLQGAVIASLDAQTGLQFETDQTADFRLFPKPGLALTNVRVTGGEGTINAMAASISADLHLLNLLTGQVRVKFIEAIGADIKVETANLPDFGIALASMMTGESDAVGSTSNGQSSSAPIIACTNCSIAFMHSGAPLERASNGTFRLALPNRNAPLSMSGKAKWRGETTDFRIRAERPETGGTPGKVSFEVSNQLGNLVFDGSSTFSDNLDGEGIVTFETPMFGRFVEWAGMDKTLGENLESLSVSSELKMMGGKVGFSGMEISSGQTSANGVIDVDLAATPPLLTGTLAFDKLDLPLVLSSLPIGHTKLANMAWLNTLAMDLRLSAASAEAGSLQLQNAAGTIRIQDGTATLDIGTAELAGGTIRGQLAIEDAAAGRQGKLTFAGMELRTSVLTDPANGLPSLEAPLSFKGEVAGTYANFSSFLQSAKGDIHIEAGAGALLNFNVDGFAKQIGDGGSFALSDHFAGMTTIDQSVLDGRIENGLLLIDTGSLSLNGRQFSLAGIIMPYAGQSLALSGSHRSNDEAPTSFFLGGTWQKPVVTTGILPPQ